MVLSQRIQGKHDNNNHQQLHRNDRQFQNESNTENLARQRKHPCPRLQQKAFRKLSPFESRVTTRVTPYASRRSNPHLSSSNNLMFGNWNNLWGSEEVFIGRKMEFIPSSLETLGADLIITIIARHTVLGG